MTLSRDVWDQIKPADIHTDYEDSILYNIRDTFKDNLYWEEIYKNDDTSTVYDVIISEGDKESRLDGTKRFWSYPYDAIQFDTGDYIHWGSQAWMLTSVEADRIYEVYGSIMECTQTLKRYNQDGDLVSKETPFINIKSGTIIADSDVDTLSGDRLAYVPLDDDVREWISAFRDDNESVLFPIIDEKAVYRLSHVDASESGTMATLKFKFYPTPVNNVNWTTGVIERTTEQSFTLAITPSLAELQVSDTITLEAVVKNGLGDIESKDVTWTISDSNIATINSSGVVNAISIGGAVVTCSMADNSTVYDTINITVAAVVSTNYQLFIDPSLAILRPNQYQEYEVALLNNGLPVADTFTIAIGGFTLVDNTSYYFEQTANDTFVVRNKDNDSPVVLTVNIVGALYSGSFNITLNNSLW